MEDINMIQFEFATQQHLTKIVGTYNASIPARLATADLVEVSVESKQKWFDDHNEEKRPLWIINYNHEYAGWMSFTSFYGCPVYDGTVEVSIYIEPTMQGKGLGKAALLYAEPEAKNRNIKTLLGFIFDHNEPSLKLFYNMGFEKWAHLPKIANMLDAERGLIILGKRVV